jgi:cytoskeletal protein CcmA (bactofilin family)
MVWKRKKPAVDMPVSDKVLATGEPAQPSASADAGSLGDILGRPVVTSNIAPRNLDAVKSDWADKAPEFQLPVRPMGTTRPYVIPANYKISADIFSSRPVVIRGHFAAGVVEAPTVTVEPRGVLCDTAIVENLRVAGESQAKVSATAAVEVSSRGTLSGSVNSPNLKVWPGANLKGAQVEIAVRR